MVINKVPLSTAISMVSSLWLFNSVLIICIVLSRQNSAIILLVFRFLGSSAIFTALVSTLFLMGVYSRNNTTTGLTAIDVDLTKIANIIVIYQFVVKIMLLVVIGISFSAATTFQYQSVLPCHII